MLARFLLALTAAWIAIPCTAKAESWPIAVYPMAREPGAEEDAADLQALLSSAVRMAVKERGSLVPTAPLVVEARCGASPHASAECLAHIARKGLMLWATFQRSHNVLMVSLRAVDSSARVFGPIQIKVDPFIQSNLPLARAILQLDTLARQPSVTEVSSAQATPQQPEPVSPFVAAPAESPALTENLTRPSALEKPGGSWKRPVGIAGTIGGLVVAGSGAVVVLLNGRLASSLDQKYRTGNLTWDDHGSYQTVRNANVASVVLLVAGGLITAGGATLWALAPAPQGAGLQMTMGGRF